MTGAATPGVAAPVLILYNYNMSPIREGKLANGEVYHVFTRSIAKFVVFNDHVEFGRILELIDLYRYQNFNYKFSQFLDLSAPSQTVIIEHIRSENDLLVDVIAFCIMPTHIHFAVRQVTEGGISKYLSRVLNGYSRYFNTKHKRVGPLWSGRFKNVFVNNDDQLLHLTRYIHLNPTSASLVSQPQLWKYSSYNEYVDQNIDEYPICTFKDLITMAPEQYKKFVNDRKDYQQQLSNIKSLTIDDYSG